MPQHIKPPRVTVTGTSVGDGHLKITLELDLTINLNGTAASVPAESVEHADPVGEEVGWVIPDFGTQHNLVFGKPVDASLPFQLGANPQARRDGD